MDPFENPDLLPLEDLKLRINSEGVVEVVRALSEHWVEQRYFLHYESPEIYNDDGSEIPGAKEHWTEITSYMIDDLKWLLGLPFYRFWSNIVFNTSILDTLVSFLQEAPPFYAFESFPNDPEMLELLETLRRYVLIVFARLVTNKESPAEHMSRPFFGNLLYENYIFTVPIIFDLCQLYGRENAKTVERILSSLFTLQPLYNDDLKRSVPCLTEALRNVERKFGNYSVETDRPVSLSERETDVSREITLFALEDMILYILDVSSTVNVLLKLYSPVIGIFRREDFTNKIISIYESTIPKMYKQLEKLAYNNESMPKYMELKHRLDVTRIELLELFRTIIYESVEKIQLNMNTFTETEIKECVNDYFNLLNNAISEKEFITDYYQFYPVKSDLEVLSRACPEVDTIKRDYILQSIHATIEDFKVPTVSASATFEPVAGPSGIQNTLQSGFSFDDLTSTNDKKEPIRRNSVELAVLVSEVKDILCDLGEGFIEICLKHYQYDTALVINAVLEDTLPSHLKELDPTLPHIPPDPMEASAAFDGAIGVERPIVFDNDEFDVSRVHKGKRKDKYKNINELLNDKSEVRKASDIYSKYSLISDDYDDEYDDTYDSHDIRGTAQDDAVEVDSRAFATPRVSSMEEKNDSLSEYDTESEEENPVHERNGKDHFVQNPAELRAKAEQRKQSVKGAKASSNVVGKSKGHGQDKEILINRNHKTTHKATRANHNRRSGAEWKRRQGMIPS